MTCDANNANSRYLIVFLKIVIIFPSFGWSCLCFTANDLISLRRTELYANLSSSKTLVIGGIWLGS